MWNEEGAQWYLTRWYEVLYISRKVASATCSKFRCDAFYLIPSPMATLTNLTTRVNVTRDLRHLFLSINTRRRKTAKRQSPKIVEEMFGKETETRAKDRIMKWNVVPGDFVRARGDPKTEVGMQEVRAINRYTNMVFVKGPGAVGPVPILKTNQ